MNATSYSASPVWIDVHKNLAITKPALTLEKSETCGNIDIAHLGHDSLRVVDIFATTTAVDIHGAGQIFDKSFPTIAFRRDCFGAFAKFSYSVCSFTAPVDKANRLRPISFIFNFRKPAASMASNVYEPGLKL